MEIELLYKTVGFGLLLFGSIGYALAFCRDQKQKVELLKRFKWYFERIKEEIEYGGIPLPEVFLKLAEKKEDPFSNQFGKIGQEIHLEQGEALEEVWKEKMGQTLSKTPLSERQVEFLLQFPKQIYSMERQNQSEAIQLYLKELEEMILIQDKENQNRQKMIISLGVAAGLFVALMLW